MQSLTNPSLADHVLESTFLPPPYSVAVATNGILTNHQRSAHCFPEVIHIFPNSHESSAKWILGCPRHQPLYAISRRDQPHGNKPDVILHEGLSLKDHTLASFRCLDGAPKTWKVRLPPRHAEDDPSFELVSAGNDWRAQKRPVFRFSTGTDVADEIEDFEWRSSNNDHIRCALGGQSLGWKLVRMTKDASTNDLRGPSGAWPKTSDGAEVVGVFSSGGSDPTSEWRFAFLGTGKIGVLGDRWELMAVMTSLMLMDSILRMHHDSS
ncbi:hypothetical protein BJ170DRAFT_223742 [Xylariales sp. AK1849]|nr:hypothetical protein BJ170DRAFT_223742 [Xylariales sp. AK1849]